MEGLHDQIKDEVAVGAALEDLTVITSSESDMSSTDQVVYMMVLETNNAVAQFVVDNIELNIVSIHGNSFFRSIGHVSRTTFVCSTYSSRCPSTCPRVEWKALDKAKFLKGAKVKMFSYVNRTQT